MSTISALVFSSEGISTNMALPYLEEIAKAAHAAATDTNAWPSVSPDQMHRWRVAASQAALAGGEMILGFLRAGETDLEKLREHLLRAYGQGGYDAFACQTLPHPDVPKGRGKAIGYSSSVA